ncbi:MAG: GWxTD domain-containing protein [Candidatus Latescibacteria bacterium]|nr:GWxTD domain-containing protein [Candidatus Latescibacterota bacterium]
MKPFLLCLIVSLLVCTLYDDALAKKATPEEIAQAQTRYLAGQKQIDAKAYDQAIASFLGAVELNENHAPSYVGLGHAYLETGDLKAAEKAFKKALSKKKKHAPAFNGLGLVYSQKKNELRRAIRYFRDANRADKTYSEAQYNLAKTLEAFGSTETIKEYRNVLKIDPKHHDAHYRIGKLLQRDREYENAVQAFRDQLEAYDAHDGARLQLGSLLKGLGKTDEAVMHLARVAASGGEFQRKGVLELAQVFQKRREFDKASQLFETYIGQLAEEEQAVYYDLKYVARGPVVEAFEKAENFAERKQQFDEFWQRLDPAPVSEANERQLEYYRRVSFSREFFGQNRQPWDDRGEAYIRYGDPAHISRSNNINIEQHPQVVTVKNRLIAQAGSAAVGLAQDRLTVVASGMSDADRRNEERAADVNFMGWPVYPIPLDVRWEYWIYVNVPGGMEVTFVQSNYPGPYEYAEVPLGTGNNARIWQDLNPEMVMANISARRPTTYRPDFATGPLNFHFYTAAFRGDDGQSALEVYYGIPTSEFSFVTGENGQQLALLDRGVAVYDGEGRLVYRNSEEMAFAAKGGEEQSAGALVPALDRIPLPSGNYRVNVQILDRTSGKSQVYNQNRGIPDFGVDKTLKVSDIELAASIDITDKDAFRKGDLEVIPLASQAYLPAQPVFIYFELYNLNADEFGQTQYHISYEVRSKDQKSVGARILGGVGKLLGQQSGEGVITIDYEQVGTEAQEQAYLELDLSNTEPGVQMLKIVITDQNTGQTAGVSTTFTVR